MILLLNWGSCRRSFIAILTSSVKEWLFCEELDLSCRLVLFIAQPDRRIKNIVIKIAFKFFRFIDIICGGCKSLLRLNC